MIIGLVILSGCSKKTVYINTNTQTEAKTDKATVFMIAINTDKKAKNVITNGCNDSIVPVVTTTNEYDALDPVESVSAAFSALQSMKEEEYKAKNLQNPVVKSSLKLTKVEKRDNNEVVVSIDGKLTLLDTCNALRQRGQIEQLLTNAAQGNAITIIFNGSADEWGKSFTMKA